MKDVKLNEIDFQFEISAARQGYKEISEKYHYILASCAAEIEQAWVNLYLCEDITTLVSETRKELDDNFQVDIDSYYIQSSFCT